MYGIRMVYRETFMQIHKRLILQLFQECSIPWIDFSTTGNIPVQTSTGKPVIESGDRDHNQSWAKMAQILNSFSNFSSILEETIDWNSNALPEGVSFKN